MEKLLKEFFVVIILVIQVSCIYNVEKNYQEITEETELNIVVVRLKNNRGYGIINDKYWFPSYSELIIKEKGDIKNKIELFFRKNHSTPIPRFDDLKIPFNLIKKKGENYITVVKKNDTVCFNLLKTIKEKKIE